MNHLKAFIAPALFGAAALVSPVLASANEPLEQERLIVTASRVQQTIDETLAAVSVITAEDIRLSAAEDLLELLRLQPGIDVVRTGPAGAQTSVFLRGTNSNHTLMLIDGVRVASVNTGFFALENLPLNQIERIEIVRGPRASMYGSDAIGGVIQVFTRREPGPRIKLTSGSFDSQEIAAGMGFNGVSSKFNISAAHRDSGGFSSQNPMGFSYHPDDDGYRSSNALLNGSYLLVAGNLSYSLLLNDSSTEFDQGVSDASQRIASLQFQTQRPAAWQHQLQLGYALDELDSDFRFFRTGFESRRLDFGWHHQYRLAERLQLLTGLEYFDESGESGSDYDQERSNTGLYLGLNGAIRHHQLETSIRYDENSEFGDKLTGQAAWGYRLGDRWRISTSYGTAFRAPNLNEQFSPGFGGLFAGNPSLRPESSTSLEAGLHWAASEGHEIRWQLYRTKVDDLIAFNGADFAAVNINQAEIFGLEINWAYQNNRWRANASLTLQDTKDTSTGLDLLRRPDHKVGLSVDRLLANSGWLGGELFYSSARSDFAGPLNAYTLVNLKAGWPVGPTLSIQARLENLLDEAYQPALGFNGMGRAGFVSIEWQSRR